MTLPQVMPQRELALWEREQEVRALLDAQDEELTPEQDAELQTAISEALQYAIEKREAYGLQLLRLDQQEGLAKREIERLRLRIDHIGHIRDRMKRYAINAIRALGTDQHGRFRKLAGHTLTMFLRALPTSVADQ